MTFTAKTLGIAHRRTRIAQLALLAVVLLGAVLAPGVARADVPFGLKDFDVTFTNADGSPATQAGSHPFAMTTSFDLDNTQVGPGDFDFAALKDARFEQVLGLVGDATAAPRCSRDDFLNNDVNGVILCSPNTAVGYIDLHRYLPTTSALYPVFNLEPLAGEAAQLGFSVFGNRVSIDVGVKNGPGYNIVGTSTGVTQSIRVYGAALTLWGNPADPAHDMDRGDCVDTGRSCSTSAPKKPFLTLPRACTGPLESTIDADGWIDPGNFIHASILTHDNSSPSNPQGMTGCSKLGFDPAVSSTPTTTAAGDPSGLDFGLDIADSGLTSPAGLAQADVRKTVVTLPAGMTVNPAFADGLAACSEADLARETVSSPPGAGCPSASKVGSAVVQTPLLDRAISGSLYVATQNANPFGSLLAQYLVLKDPALGIIVKQALKVDLDPQTGQLTTTVDDIPQLPFAHLGLHINGGDRGALIAPAACGTASTHSVLTPSSSDNSVQRDSPATIDQQCDRASKFAPSFSAGTTNSNASAHSTLVMDIERPDGQQALKALDVSLPAGLLGKIRGVPPCPDDQATVGTCAAASKIGSVQVSAGAGIHPLWVPQAGKAPTAAYLAGPYKGAPYSLSVVVPAQAGPFDLGTVVVRTALYVDPNDAHITARSDPFPTILQGIPLEVREIRVTLDRPDFILNPTNCDQKQITGQIRSDQGATADIADRFKASDCTALPFAPKLSLALSGKGQTTDGKHPAVTANLTQEPGQANLKKVRVALPLSLALDPDNANGLCEFVDGSTAEPTCPKASIVGSATAVTPILDEPLSGPVYFVKNIRKDPKSGREIRTLPKLVIPLVGQNGVKLTLTGTSAVEDDQLVSTFDNTPDAPVSSFKLNINGGKAGILVVSDADICKSTQVADQQIDGQNGKQADADVYIQTPSCALKVLSKKVGRSSVAVKVGGLGAGKVTVSGKGIKKTTKTISKSTVATVTAKRTKGKPGKVTVSYDPAGPTKARKTSK